MLRHPVTPPPTALSRLRDGSFRGATIAALLIMPAAAWSAPPGFAPATSGFAPAAPGFTPAAPSGTALGGTALGSATLGGRVLGGAAPGAAAGPARPSVGRTFLTPRGPAIVTGGSGSVATAIVPGAGGQGFLFNNGNGTSTLVAPGSAPQVVPTPK